MTNMSRSGGRDIMSLREAMDRLLEDSFVRFGEFSLGNIPGFAVPLLNVYEINDNLVVQAALPGMKPEDLEISVTGEVLTLKGTVKAAPEKDGRPEETYHRREWQRASFERSLTLPWEVDADKATSTFENGVLTLTLPKAESIKPKRLQIKTK